MPLQRRIPKRGFTPHKRTVYQIVNVGDLARVDGTTVNAEVLKEAGLIRSAEGLIKILANGEVNQAYSVEAHGFSGGAVTKIEGAGGSATVLTRGGGNGAADADESAGRLGIHVGEGFAVGSTCLLPQAVRSYLNQPA